MGRRYSLLLLLGALASVLSFPTNQTTDYEALLADQKMPEDVVRFQEFLLEYDTILGLISSPVFPGSENHASLPTATATADKGVEMRSQILRTKRQAGDSVDVSGAFTPDHSFSNAGSTCQCPVTDDVKGKVKAELNRIFMCYKRIRCEITKEQAEQDCKWLESSELHQQIMRVLGVHNPRRAVAQHKVQGRHVVVPKPRTSQGPVGPVSVPAARHLPDAVINPAHSNLKNGITHAQVLPGNYLPRHLYPPKNRRAYDSFFSPAPIQTQQLQTGQGQMR